MFERCLYFNANKMVRKINRIWQDAYAEINLSPAHAYLLRAILKQPDSRLSALAEELSLAPSTISRFVDALIAKELLLKKQGVDGREFIVSPTEKAEALEDRLEAIGDNLYRTMCRRIGSASLEDLVATLRAMESEVS